MPRLLEAEAQLSRQRTKVRAYMLQLPVPPTEIRADEDRLRLGAMADSHSYLPVCLGG